MKRKVLLIDDLCTADANGDDYIAGIRQAAGAGVQIEPYIFRTTDYKAELLVAIAQAKEYDAVLLDVLYGNNEPLGTEIALPKLAQEGIPVILFSDSYSKAEAFVRSAESLQYGRVFPVTVHQLSSLQHYVEGLHSTPENFATIDHGFQFRDEAEIEQREQIQAAFQSAMQKFGCRRIEVPIVAPVSNFLGDGKMPRPLSAKTSNRLFSAIANDGTPLAVRYEGTALAAKWVASQLRNKKGKHFNVQYFQEMVRVEFREDLDAAHYRGFYQAGLELFSLDYARHLENIMRTIEALNEFAQKVNPRWRVRIRLSHLDVLNKPLTEFLPRKDSKFAHDKLKHVMEKGTSEELDKMLSSVAPDERLAQLLRALKALQSEKATITTAIERLRALHYYSDSDIGALLDIAVACAGLQDIVFDPGILRSLNFYSGITVQGDLMLDDGMLLMSEVFGGGEFTGMVESFGYYDSKVHSFGLAFGVERLLPYLNRA